MEAKKAGWLSKPAISWRRALTVWALVSLAFIGFSLTNSHASIDDHLAKRLGFYLRQTLGLEPAINDNLKIIAFDDATLSRMGKDSLSYLDWAILIDNLSRHNPKAIIIDKAFAATPSPAEDLQALQNALINAGNVYVGALQTPAKAVAGELIDGNSYRSFWSEVISGNREAAKLQVEAFAGPNKELLPYFAGVGHFMYQGYGRYRGIERNDQFSYLPHLTFYAADSVERRHGDILLNGTKTFSLEKNGFFANLLSLEHFVSSGKMASMHYFLEKDGRNFISEGDVVLIFLEFFTGGSDFKDTPVGYIPGGLIMASVINSILDGRWLSTLDLKWAAPCLGAAIGVLIAWFASGPTFWLCFLASLGAAFSASLFLFAEYSILTPWLWLDLSMIISGAIIFVEKHRVIERRNHLINHSLSDKLSPYQMQKVLGDPSLLDVGAYQKTVSLMFLDIVGYSRYSENTPPHQVFEGLRHLLGDITHIIHKHGGSINNTFGDGLLALFGYDFDGEETAGNHAKQATECAVELQKIILKKNLAANKRGLPIHPIRIGINTGVVTIGDIGDDERFNFTIIGHSVNYAKRLEEACEFYRIMLGEKTVEMCGLFDNSVNEICKRLILMKHHSRPLEAFELDPLTSDPALAQRAQKEYWNFAGIAPREKRINIPESQSIVIHTNYGDGYLTDFSHDGMAFYLKSYLANGMTVEITLGEKQGDFHKELIDAQLLPISGEVRWGSNEEAGYRHGVLLRNLNQRQKEVLFNLISNELLKEAEAAS